MILFKNNLLSRQTRLLSKVSVLSISVRFSKNVAKNAVQNTVQSTTPKTAHHTFTQAQTANVCGRNAFSSSFSQTLQPRASQQARAQQAAANLPLGLNKIGIANSNNSNTNSNNTTIPASTYNTKNVPTNNTNIKGFAGPQFRSISMIVEDKDLQFYSGYLDPKIANEGLLEINFYSLVYNAMLSTNPGTVTYTLAKQNDPGIFWFSDPNNR